MVVPARAHSGIPAAAGLLLWARQAEYIDRLLQQRRAIVGSATLSAYTYVAEDRSVTDVVMFRGMCACLCVSVICLRVGNSGDQAMQTRLNRSMWSRVGPMNRAQMAARVPYQRKGRFLFWGGEVLPIEMHCKA